MNPLGIWRFLVEVVNAWLEDKASRLGAAEVNHLLVARHNGIDRRILSRPQTFEAKVVFVIGKRTRNVDGEEQRRNLKDHVTSLQQIFGG